MAAMIIGLTGGIASGKSTVSALFQKRGFTMIDADDAARKVVEVGKEAYEKIVDHFGKEILQADGAIDRKKLGAIIFHDKEKRLLLNSIVHPAVRKQMNDSKTAALANGKQTVLMDIPLLYESKLTDMVDRTIVVYVDEHIQLQRLMDRNQLSKADAEARISSQLPLQEKKTMADAVINNNRTIKETEIQLDELIKKWNLKP
ncbi:dephospho-CoA kinase [Bacillus chungangensis]|uniref:Dephospho-CoA kinase n=1 Tax=Bacillus chungangensis TaxID=587633 RepID=A0ABT9WP20_9BACI|nr:dephospho-CoA kinase [Bacillus chungangensis]MDQ0174525.1 dephospho-CoA kinase [Bacillus chungangensis]